MLCLGERTRKESVCTGAAVERVCKTAWPAHERSVLLRPTFLFCVTTPLTRRKKDVAVPRLVGGDVLRRRNQPDSDRRRLPAATLPPLVPGQEAASHEPHIIWDAGQDTRLPPSARVDLWNKHLQDNENCCPTTWCVKKGDQECVSSCLSLRGLLLSLPAVYMCVYVLSACPLPRPRRH